MTVNPASEMVRAAAWRQTATLFADGAPEVRREAIRRAQLFGLVEAYPALVRETLGEVQGNRQAALEAIQSVDSRYRGGGYRGETVPADASARSEFIWELSESSGVNELTGMYDGAADAIEIVHASREERQEFIQDLIGRLREDWEYGPEDVPGGCGFGMEEPDERVLRFVAVRSRSEFHVLAGRHLANPKAVGRGRLVSLIEKAGLVQAHESAIRSLLDHPDIGLRVPALLAMSNRLPVADLKRRMLEDPSGAVRVVAFWALAAHDHEVALKLALPRLEKMVPDERFQVLVTLDNRPDGRKRLQALAQHKDGKVAKEVRDLLRAFEEQERDTIRP